MTCSMSFSSLFVSIWCVLDATFGLLAYSLLPAAPVSLQSHAVSICLLHQDRGSGLHSHGRPVYSKAWLGFTIRQSERLQHRYLLGSHLSRMKALLLLLMPGLEVKAKVCHLQHCLLRFVYGWSSFEGFICRLSFRSRLGLRILLHTFCYYILFEEYK